MEKVHQETLILFVTGFGKKASFKSIFETLVDVPHLTNLLIYKNKDHHNHYYAKITFPRRLLKIFKQAPLLYKGRKLDLSPTLTQPNHGNYTKKAGKPPASNRP